MKSFLFAISLLSISSLLQAQVYYQGSILKGNKKEEGFIHYEPSKKEHSNLLFKKSKSDAPVPLSADSIDSFRIDKFNTQFISSIDLNSKTGIFSEILIAGPLTLSRQNSLHILTKADGSTFQLRLPIRKNTYSSMDQVIDKKLLEIRTLGSLTKFLDAEDSIDIQRLSGLNLAKLESFVIDYNNSKGTISVRRKPYLSLGLIAGLNMTFLTLEGTSSSFNSFVGFKFGITVDFNPNLFHDKSVLNIQLLYFDSKVEENSDGGLKIKSQTLRVPIAFKIYLKNGQRGFFVNPGVTPYYTLNYSVENDIFLAPITMNKIGGAVFAGVGWDSYLGGKKVTLNLKYEQDFLSPYNWEATQRYLQFDLGYRF